MAGTTATPRASDVVAALDAHADPTQRAAIARRVRPGEPVQGIRMGTLFDVAKTYRALPLDGVAALLDEPAYEPRMAAFCILDFQARTRSSTAERAERCALYLDRHDAITAWDMVDRAAPRVVGQALAGSDLEPLRGLAASDDPLRRRTALTAPLWFARYGASSDDVTRALEIAAGLADDHDPQVARPLGILLKHTGDRWPDAVVPFLEQHGPAMSRPAVRLATERLDEADRDRLRR